MQLTTQPWAVFLKQGLVAQGHSLNWLAHQVHLSPSTLSRMFRGHPDYKMTERLMVEIAQRMQIPVEWIGFEEGK